MALDIPTSVAFRRPVANTASLSCSEDASLKVVVKVIKFVERVAQIMLASGGVNDDRTWS
jgi:hypothetical protein